MRLGWLLTAAATASTTTASRRLTATAACALPSTSKSATLFLASSSSPYHRRLFTSIAMASASPSISGETLQVKRLSQDAVLPVRGSEWAAGYDLAR